MTTQNDEAISDDRVLELTCVFDAPLPTIFDAWTQPELMMHWWAPRGFTTETAEMECRVGGHWRVRMRAPQGSNHVEAGAVLEYVPLQRLVLTHAWNTPAGTPGHETRITVDFAQQNGKTRMEFRQGAFESKRSKDQHDEGWVSALTLLAEHLGGHFGAATLGRPGAAGELMQHARPMLEIIRAQVSPVRPRPAQPQADEIDSAR